VRLHLDPQEVRATESGPSNVSGAQGASARPAVTGRDTPSADKDTVAISATSSAIARLSAEHSSKIAGLLEAVRSGAYQLSSEILSAAIVSRSIG
jgi:anti-sigma28 factor (negative regulator of flagellin synthesis)